MRKTVLAASSAAAMLLVTGWALAQPAAHRPGAMHDSGPGMGARPGAAMGRGMGMGPGMMGMGRGSATMEERGDIHGLLFNHERITRTVTNLPNGIRTVTESDDPDIASAIKRHVAQMGARVEEGRDPGLPIESPALRSLFPARDKIKSTYRPTEKGYVVIQTSTDPTVVKALQLHAAEVSDLARRGMVAAHETMMKNGRGMMGRGMGRPADEPGRDE